VSLLPVDAAVVLAYNLSDSLWIPAQRIHRKVLCLELLDQPKGRHAMQIHHLNCASIHTHTRFPGVTHCLLVEMDERLLLVDTGFGIQDHRSPTRHMQAFMTLNGVPRDPAETAIQQIGRLGYAPENVQHIVLTHLHLDHAGGLPDFPWAQVHVLAQEHVAATRRRRWSLKEASGYHPAHWAHGPQWVIHHLEGKRWFGLECTRVMDRPGCEVQLVALAGHSLGHCGVAVRTTGGWMLHCGDAYVRQMQVDPYQARNPFPGWARPLANSMFPSKTLATIRALLRNHGGEVEVFCSHDRVEFARYRADQLLPGYGWRAGQRNTLG
jgi:glyoxylase-like metal-dependent hydrolase (beta-lactamase superfamily II)